VIFDFWVIYVEFSEIPKQTVVDSPYSTKKANPTP